MNRRRLLILPLAAAAVLAPTQAWAFFSTSSTGVVGKVSVNALGVPTASAAQNSTTATITVSAQPAIGPTPTGYRVDRVSPVAANNVCTITGATGSCTDPGFSSAGNTYKVYATLNNWIANSAATATATVSTAFTVTASTTQTAGTSFNLTVTATQLGVTDTSYTGSQTITITGASNSPNNTAPTLPVTANFVNGVATVPVTMTNVAATTLTVTAAAHTGSTAPINVGIAPQTYVLTGPSSIAAGSPYTLTSITAKDIYGNGFTGNKTITWSGAGTVGSNAPVYPSGAVAFSNGVAGPISGFTFYKAETFNLTAATSGVTSGQTNVTVTPLAVSNLKWQTVTNSAGTISPTCIGATTCSVTNLGKNGTVTATLLVTDSLGNPISAVVNLSLVSTGGTINVASVTSGANGITGSFIFTGPGNNGYNGSVTATSGGGTATLNVAAQ